MTTPRKSTLPYHVIHGIEDALAAAERAERRLSKIETQYLPAQAWACIAEARADLKDIQLHLSEARRGKVQEEKA